MKCWSGSLWTELISRQLRQKKLLLPFKIYHVIISVFKSVHQSLPPPLAYGLYARIKAENYGWPLNLPHSRSNKMDWVCTQKITNSFAKCIVKAFASASSKSSKISLCFSLILYSLYNDDTLCSNFANWSAILGTDQYPSCNDLSNRSCILHSISRETGDSPYINK